MQAGTVRDSMAKSLYSALFDWIVFRTNHALLNNKDLEDNSKVPIKKTTTFFIITKSSRVDGFGIT